MNQISTTPAVAEPRESGDGSSGEKLYSSQSTRSHKRYPDDHLGGAKAYETQSTTNRSRHNLNVRKFSSDVAESGAGSNSSRHMSDNSSNARGSSRSSGSDVINIRVSDVSAGERSGRGLCISQSEVSTCNHAGSSRSDSKQSALARACSGRGG